MSIGAGDKITWDLKTREGNTEVCSVDSFRFSIPLRYWHNRIFGYEREHYEKSRHNVNDLKEWGSYYLI